MTEAGRARFREAAPLHLRGIQRHFARHVTADEARSLHGLLGRLLEAQGKTFARPARRSTQQPVE
jgi:hypothetical protein